jgi:pilus assembly protein FimV
MHDQLCPDATFPLGRDEPVASHEMPVGDDLDGNNTDTESESVSGPVAGIGTPSDLDTIDTSEERALLQTQVLFSDNGASLREEATSMPGMVGEILDLEVTLNEADVYLAYGLYENAEYLLLKGLEVDPQRADFLARLLDSYYATRNVVDFVTCAEAMLDMGEAGAEYWERVEVMGYELAPYNNLFADGKDKSLSTVELQIPKPETADFEFSEIDESSQSAFTDIEIGQDVDSHLSESTITDIQIGKYLDDDSEPADFECNDIDESGESAFVDSEIAQDDESPLSESTFTDIQVGKYLDNDSEAADLNLDLETNELHEEDSDLLDGLISELDDSSETDESGMAGDDESLEINLDATTDDSTPALTVSFEAAEDELKASLVNEAAEDDESFEVNPDTTMDGFDPVLTVDLEAAEDELKASIADDLEDDDEVIDLDYGNEDAIRFTMGQGSQGDKLKSEQSTPVDSDDASLELLDDPTVDTLFGVKLGSDNSRILYFPDSPSEDRDIDKFESEVKTTLQAIRDQLQNMTERLFQQERATNDLKQTIAELKNENMPVGKNIKESG